MNIVEAVKKAIKVNGYISRKDYKGRNFVFIKPTNGNDCCIICLTKNHSRRGWQPRASDFLSNDWEVFTEADFLSLSEENSPFLE